MPIRRFDSLNITGELDWMFKALAVMLEARGGGLAQKGLDTLNFAALR
jgi:hypothetical protein